MKVSFNNSAKPSNNRTKSKSARESPDHALDRHGSSLLTRNRHSIYSRQVQSITTTYRTIHFIETFNQRSIQHLQRLTMGQTPEINPAQSFIARIRGVLLLPRLQGAPNHPLQGPPKITWRDSSSKTSSRSASSLPR